MTLFERFVLATASALGQLVGAILSIIFIVGVLVGFFWWIPARFGLGVLFLIAIVTLFLCYFMDAWRKNKCGP
jgi:uncharacterized membrane protein YkgB